MKLFLTVVLSLCLIALIAHAQQLPPPPAYPPPPSGYYPPPPAPEMAPPEAPPPGGELIPPPPAYPPSAYPPAAYPPSGSQQAVRPAVPPPQNQAPSALQAQQQGNITFVSGGAGDDDRDALRQVEGQYNLRLMFAARSGAFLANVAVTLADARGNTVLDTISEGPIFYARVPPGRYRLTVSNQSQAQTRDLSIGPGNAVRQDFYWAAAG